VLKNNLTYIQVPLPHDHSKDVSLTNKIDKVPCFIEGQNICPEVALKSLQLELLFSSWVVYKGTQSFQPSILGTLKNAVIWIFVLFSVPAS
jgi:hypothetical protein